MKRITLIFTVLFLIACTESDSILVSKDQYKLLLRNMTESRKLFSQMMMEEEGGKLDVRVLTAYSTNASIWLSVGYSGDAAALIGRHEACEIMSDVKKFSYYKTLNQIDYSEDEHLIIDNSLKVLESLIGGLSLECVDALDNKSPGDLFEDYLNK